MQYRHVPIVRKVKLPMNDLCLVPLSGRGLMFISGMQWPTFPVISMFSIMFTSHTASGGQ